MKTIDFKVKTWDDIYNLNKYTCLCHQQYHKAMHKVWYEYNLDDKSTFFLIGLN